MKKLLHITTVVLLFIGQYIQAQDLEAFKDAFAKSATYYKTQPHYILNVSYAFYEDTAKQSPDEAMDGRVIKKGADYYSKIDQTEFVYVGGTFVKINHQEKALLYGKNKQEAPVTPIPIDQLLALCKDAKQITQAGNLVFDIALQPQFGLPYSSMRLELDKDTYAIQKQEIYLAAGQAYPWQGLRSKVSETPAKMVITLTEVPFNEEVSQEVFQLTNYIRQGRELRPAQSLTAYALYDATK